MYDQSQGIFIFLQSDLGAFSSECDLNLRQVHEESFPGNSENSFMGTKNSKKSVL